MTDQLPADPGNIVVPLRPPTPRPDKLSDAQMVDLYVKVCDLHRVIGDLQSKIGPALDTISNGGLMGALFSRKGK